MLNATKLFFNLKNVFLKVQLIVFESSLEKNIE